MISLDHVIEVALLLLVSYLAGCALGYLAHLALRAYAGRQRFEPRVRAQAVAGIREQVPAEPTTSKPRSAARRLAGAVEREIAQPIATSAPVTQQQPADLPAPRGGRADDLKKIKGIGAKTESALNDLGIYHFDQIAAWTPTQVDWLEGRIAIKGRIRREQWVEQAILLMTATASA